MSNLTDWADTDCRPKSFDEIVGNEWTVRKLRRLAEAGNFPSMVFFGPPGVGKSCCAEILSNAVDAELKEWNASDDNRLQVIREQVKDFARGKTTTHPFKVAFMDEANRVTPDGQEALRRIEEKFSTNCRFILTSNYLYDIIAPIRSRLDKVEFRKLTHDEVFEILSRVVERKSLKELIDEDCVFEIASSAEGDARFAIKTLQGLVTGRKDKVRREELQLISRTVPVEEVGVMLSLAFNGEYTEAVKKFKEISTFHASQQIFEVIEKEFLESNFTDKQKAIIGAGLGQIKDYMLGDSKSMFGFLAFLAGV